MQRPQPENMALQKDSQKAFSSAMKSIKNLIKVGKVKVPKGIKKNEKGVVLLRHVPHGFYEKQMSLFFEQFGKVSNLKLYRSPKTGKSLGYAFVEFKLKEVAEIVAETMNNYLMFTKLVKASLVENPSPKIFIGKRITEANCKGAIRRRRERIISNKELTEDEASVRKAKSNRKLKKMLSKIDGLGLDCDIQVAGAQISNLNETGNTMVSVDFSSDEEISVRIKRKSVMATVNVPNKAKKLTKAKTPKAETPVVKKVATRKSLRRKSVV